MILPRPQDAIHKAWLYRVLMALSDTPLVMEHLRFKGGTCAAMLGWIDRFSVDLDFDFIGSPSDIPPLRSEMERVFQRLGLTIKDASKTTPQYFLKYPARYSDRNTVKIDVTFPPPRANQYARLRFNEIDRIIPCETRETLFANKLVAPLDRFAKTKGIAGRDCYDIHHFLMNGMRYADEVITERTGKTIAAFLTDLIAFIDGNVTDTLITQDLSTLLAPDQFKRIRHILIPELRMLLKDELQRRSGGL